MQTKPWKFKHNQVQSGQKDYEGGWISFQPSQQKKNIKNLQKNNRRLGTKRTCIGRKTFKTDKWNSKLQGVIKKLTLSFTLQIWAKIQSTTFPILPLFNIEMTTPIILHKSTSTSTISTFTRIKQKQEWEIGNELKDWELGMVISTFKHSKKLCAAPTFLDS